MSERKEFLTVEFTIPFGGEHRSEDDAYTIVRKLEATAKRLGIGSAFVEQDWER